MLYILKSAKQMTEKRMRKVSAQQTVEPVGRTFRIRSFGNLQVGLLIPNTEFREFASNGLLIPNTELREFASNGLLIPNTGFREFARSACKFANMYF